MQSQNTSSSQYCFTVLIALFKFFENYFLKGVFDFFKNGGYYQNDTFYLKTPLRYFFLQSKNTSFSKYCFTVLIAFFKFFESYFLKGVFDFITKEGISKMNTFYLKTPLRYFFLQIKNTSSYKYSVTVIIAIFTFCKNYYLRGVFDFITKMGISKMTIFLKTLLRYCFLQGKNTSSSKYCFTVFITLFTFLKTIL